MLFFGFSGSGCGEDACTATDTGDGVINIALLASLAPFVVTFAGVFVVVSKEVFPRLARLQQKADDGADHYLPPSAPAALREAHAAHGARSLRRQLAATAFASTTALAAVLAELILSEMVEVVDPAARSMALRMVVPALLVLLVLVIPFLELQSVLSGSGWSFQRSASGKVPRTAWLLQLVAFGGWLFVFWSLVGRIVPSPVERYLLYASRDAADRNGGFDSSGVAMASRLEGVGSVLASMPGSDDDVARTLARACLERVGVIGISLMALLSGFASVSAPWQTFGRRRGSAQKRRPITNSDVERKEASLALTNDLLLTKRHRLRSLQRKIELTASGQAVAASVAAEAAAGASGSGGEAATIPSGNSMLGKLVGSIKGMVGGMSGEAAEIKSLEMEILGLETMAAGLATSIEQLQTKRAAEARAGTALGRVITVANAAFGLYCLYRIAATVLAMVRRVAWPASGGGGVSTADPVSRVLSLLARHWDPALDQAAWARQISFLLSGVILAASGNSVVQTFRLFVRWTPAVLHQAQANLALLVAQTAATYVISAALLLRSSLPKEMGSAVGDALDSALEGRFVDRWFEGWFLVASAATVTGLWIGQTIAVGDGLDGWDEYGLEEMGQKQS